MLVEGLVTKEGKRIHCVGDRCTLFTKEKTAVSTAKYDYTWVDFSESHSKTINNYKNGPLKEC